VGEELVFTGIIEALGTVKTKRSIPGGYALTIASDRALDSLIPGASIAIDGVCQTITEIHGDTFQVQAVGETLEKTTLGSVKLGQRVNLERSLQVGGRLDGHMVQGHVSNTGSIRKLVKLGDNFRLQVELGRDEIRYVVREGSLAVDGISFTVAAISGNLISINVVPYTVAATNLQFKRAGDPVNVETDIIGRYIEKLLPGNSKPQDMSQWFQAKGWE
jgi:riboflavin synthase